MKKVSTVGAKQSKNFREQKLTIGLDLGDRSSWYCVLDEADVCKRTVKKSNCQIRPRSWQPCNYSRYNAWLTAIPPVRES